MQNGWVRVDATLSCNVFNSIYGSSPSWGMTGEGAEAITQNLMCCKSTHTSKTSPPTKAPVTSEVTASDSSPVTPQPTNKVTEKPTNDKMVEETFDKNAAKYIPSWFDRSAWKGTSYVDAVEFCGSRGWMLCPYEVRIH
jgi:hypothetical protein